MSQLANLLSGSVTKFLSVGVLNTIVGLAIIYACKLLFGMHDISANMMGYAFGFLLSYSLNSRWTFKYVGPPLPALIKFSFSALLAYLSNLAVVMAAINLGGINSYFAQALGVPTYTAVAYVLSKHYVFPGPAEARDEVGGDR